MAVAYRGVQAASLPASGTISERRIERFATFVEAMFARRGAVTQYSEAQTRRWLGWLASTLFQQSQTVFYIDHVQPYWLPTPEL